MDELRKFVAPEFIFGPGALDSTGSYARQFAADKALVVTDEGVLGAGWAQKVAASLEKEGLATEIYSNISPNPRDHEVMEGAETFLKTGCDLIVAVGGGSPIDCAKGIGIVSSNEQHILEFEGIDRVPVPGPPLICVPTTAGSSADISQFSIICDSSRMVKIAIISKSLVPDLSLIDPATTTTLPKNLTAETGMDALVHAIEAYVSNASSPITDINAIKAVSLIREHLPQALNHPLDMDHRYNMMLASLLAGLAFSNASLGLVHAMAHSLGGRFDLSHGESNAILLAPVVDFNFHHAREKYSDLALAMGLEPFRNPEETRQGLLETLADFGKGLGITTRLSHLGISKKELPALAGFAMTDPCIVTNPVMPTQKEVEEIYAKTI
ncbi:MAG: iron-containing alcohol dehydrogenase [Desulfobacteraceae bacterium]|nr:iron-containing alcohol dehydrogenase [Desulfobacteraceae bacterium]